MAVFLPVSLNVPLTFLRVCPYHGYQLSKAGFRIVLQMSSYQSSSMRLLHSNYMDGIQAPDLLLNARMAVPAQSPWKTQNRFKSHKRKADSDSDEEAEDSDEELEASKDFQVIKGSVKTTRIDAVFKFALGMSRNKVDNAFYASKIYRNGEKLLKKSELLTMEDELDVVRQQNKLNPAFLDISRLEVLDIHRSSEDKISLKVRRFKRLTVENYAQPWKPVQED